MAFGRWMYLPLLGAAALFAGCSGSSEDVGAPKTARCDWQPVDSALAATLETELEEARADQDLPGMAMAVAYRDTCKLWVSATGMSDLAAQTPWTPTNQSRIGSITKTFTTALVMQLSEEGVLNLDDPIEKWVPGWYTGPTLRHLLGNTSGIASYNYVGSFDHARSYEPQELVQWAFDHAPVLHFEPGTQWEYSNTNFVLLGLVAEAAMDQSYADALQSRLFNSLELSDTRLAVAHNDSPRLVRCYQGTPPRDVSGLADPSSAWAAGAITSTPSDLAKWTISLYGSNDAVSQSSLELMTTKNPVSGQSGQEPYGLGTFVEGDGVQTLHGHTGGIAGYMTSAYYMPDKAVAVVVMSNLHGTKLRAASAYGWAVVLGVDYP